MARGSSACLFPLKHVFHEHFSILYMLCFSVYEFWTSQPSPERCPADMRLFCPSRSASGSWSSQNRLLWQRTPHIGLHNSSHYLRLEGLGKILFGSGEPPFQAVYHPISP